VFYWREGTKEVDFVLKEGKSVTAIEVKSGRRRENVQSLDLFMSLYRPKRVLLVGTGGIPLDEFLESLPSDWL